MGSGIPRMDGSLGKAELRVSAVPDHLFNPLSSPLQGAGTRFVSETLPQLSSLVPDLCQGLM